MKAVFNSKYGYSQTGICDICLRGRNKGNHATCSKIRQTRPPLPKQGKVK